MTPVPAVLIRLGALGDEPGIERLWRESGEGAVDIRSRREVRAAILQRRILVIEAGGQVAGTASYFVRDHGDDKFSVEMGGLTIIERYRHLGLAQLMAICRLILILPGWANAPILSEVYPSSLRSLRYLFRLGFQALDHVPLPLHQAAWEANSKKPVVYMVADPLHYSNLCLKFAAIEREGHTYGAAGPVNVAFHKELNGLAWHVHSAQKQKYAASAFGNHDGIGFGRNLSRWLARHFGSACITRSEFLIGKGLEPESWGYEELSLNGLAVSFLRTLKGAATS